MSLRTRLVLLVLCVALPCAGAMVWAIAATYGREQASVNQSLRETTRALALAVSRELGAAEAVGRTLAASPELQNNNLTAFYEQAARVTQPGGGWVVLLDQDRMVLNTSLPLGADLPLRSPSGHRNAEPSGSAAAVSPLFTGPLARRRAVAVTVRAAQPGTAPFDISVVVPPERIQGVLDDQRLPTGWLSGVIDQNGNMVARRPDPERWIGRQATETMRRQILEHGEGFFQATSLDGIITTAFITKVPGTAWTLAIAVPDTLIRANATRSLLEAIAAASVMLLAALWAAFIAARRLVAPAIGLQEAALALQRGQVAGYKACGVSELDIAGAALVAAATQIREANVVLEDRVVAAISQERVAQQKVEAAQRFEALSRLTGGVAHDVNNLLAVVANSCTLLERRPDDNARGERFAAIRRAIANGRELTQKLMSFSRQRRHDARTVDLRAWLPEVLPDLEHAAGAAVRIELNLSPETAPVSVDAVEMRLALLNLAANSGHAMGPSGGALSISTGNDILDEAKTVVITLEDTGPGVPESIRERVFEPFFTTASDEGRTGLGLSQVYGFCQLSGGAVKIASTSTGATFVLTLPAAGPSSVTASSVGGEQPINERMRLLYVEDNVDLGELSRIVLEDMGYAVTWVLSGDAALAESRKASFDIVLSDFMLPGSLNGLDLGLRVRTEHPNLPFVLLTGYAEQGVRAAAAGFEVLYKPCPVEELEAKLEQMLGVKEFPHMALDS